MTINSEKFFEFSEVLTAQEMGKSRKINVMATAFILILFITFYFI